MSLPETRYLWPSLLPPYAPLTAAPEAELALRHAHAAAGTEPPRSNRTLLAFCKDELSRQAHSSVEQRRRKLQLAHAAGLSVPEVRHFSGSKATSVTAVDWPCMGMAKWKVFSYPVCACMLAYSVLN